jgi:hypothetical protein
MRKKQDPWGDNSNVSDNSFDASKVKSVRREQELSKSDISCIEKSPFLQLKKEPLGQIAGTPFEFVQPLKTDPRI